MRTHAYNHLQHVEVAYNSTHLCVATVLDVILSYADKVSWVFAMIFVLAQEGSLPCVAFSIKADISVVST